MNLFDLTGKVALVTGANQGLGKGIAKGLAEQGAEIVILDLKINKETIAEFEKAGHKASGFEFNLGKFDEYDSIIAEIVKKVGKIDILVNNAGVQKRHPAVEFPKKDWDFVIDINMNAVFYMCQKVGKLMLEQGYGKIVNLASLLSFQGGFTVPAYAASKGGVMQFSKSLANEWAGKGITINCIAPGYMATEMNTALMADETRSRQILERIPAGRWGTPQDLAGAAIFLASPASDYINGHVIAVDGGWLGR